MVHPRFTLQRTKHITFDVGWYSILNDDGEKRKVVYMVDHYRHKYLHNKIYSKIIQHNIMVVTSNEKKKVCPFRYHE